MHYSSAISSHINLLPRSWRRRAALLVLFFLRTMHISCLLTPRTVLPIFFLILIISRRELCLRLFSLLFLSILLYSILSSFLNKMF